MDRPYKSGTKVVCKADCPRQFTRGNIYLVGGPHNSKHTVGVLADDRGVPNGWGYERFEVASEPFATDADRGYYDWLPGIKCYDVVRHFSFPLGCAIKYIWRAGRKGGATRESDLRKAIDYLRYELGETPGETK